MMSRLKSKLGNGKMPRPAFQQAQIDSVIRAAARAGSTAHFDSKTLVFTIYPPDFYPARLSAEEPEAERRGKEYWD